MANIAGITQPIKVADTTVEDWDPITGVNMNGTFLVSKAAAAVMAKHNYGRIVNMSSVSAKRGGGVLGGAHYSAAKAGILGFAKALAREVAADGITVNSVAPGLVLTDIRAVSRAKRGKRAWRRYFPIKRLCHPDEIAALVCFLASEEAGYITGEDIDINGGSHMD